MKANSSIKEIREKLGLTQEQLARAIGVSWVTVNRWERNKAKPSPLAASRLQELFKKGTSGSPSRQK